LSLLPLCPLAVVLEHADFFSGANESALSFQAGNVDLSKRFW
jgi:hypothetical protein